MALSPKYLDPKQVYQLAPAFWDWVLLTLIFSYIFKKAFAKFAHGTAGHGMFGSPMGHGHGRMLSVDNALAFILGLTVSTLLVSVRGFTFKGFVDAGNLGLLLGIMFGFMAYSAAMNREMAKHGIMPGMMGGFGMGGHGIAVPRSMPLTVGAITGLFTYALLTIGTNISEWIGSLFWLIAIGIIFSVIGAKQAGSVAGAFGSVTGDVGRLHDNVVQTQSTAVKASKTVDDLVKDYSANFNTLGEGLAAARGIIANKGWFKFSKEQKGKLKSVLSNCLSICSGSISKMTSILSDYEKIKKSLEDTKKLETSLTNDLSVLINKPASQEIKTKITDLNTQFTARISDFDKQLKSLVNTIGTDLSGLQRLSNQFYDVTSQEAQFTGLLKDIDSDNFAEGVKKLELFERLFTPVYSELGLIKHTFDSLKVMFKGVSDLVGPYDKALADLRKQYEALSGELSEEEKRVKLKEELTAKCKVVNADVDSVMSLANSLDESKTKAELINLLEQIRVKLVTNISTIASLQKSSKDVDKQAYSVLIKVGAFMAERIQLIASLKELLLKAKFRADEKLSVYANDIDKTKIISELVQFKDKTIWITNKASLAYLAYLAQPELRTAA